MSQQCLAAVGLVIQDADFVLHIYCLTQKHGDEASLYVVKRLEYECRRRRTDRSENPPRACSVKEGQRQEGTQSTNKYRKRVPYLDYRNLKALSADECMGGEGRGGGRLFIVSE